MERFRKSIFHRDSRAIINAKHPILETLTRAFEEDKDSVKKYAEILYDQALLIEGLPIEDPVAFSNAVCDLMTK